MASPRFLRPSTAFALSLAALPAAAQTTSAQRPHVPTLPAPTSIAKTQAPPAAPGLVEPPRVAPPQTPASMPPKSDGGAPLAPKIDRSIVHYQTAGDGSLWIRGANYKMRFAGDGTSYVPFLSSSAPKDFDVHMSLGSVTVGGEALALDPTAAPARSDSTVRFDRGAVDEVYKISAESIEQEFVIDSLPSSGDVDLRVDVTTELTPKVSDAGFEFANEFGSVHCGGATAIDASGHSLALTSEWLADGAISIHLPSSFVANAALPIVVDPLWFTVSLESSSMVESSPDVVHMNGGYLFVSWEEVFSTNDHDVYTELIDGGGGVYWAHYVDYTFNHWVRPRAGHIDVDDRVLVAGQVGQPGFREIWGEVLVPWSATWIGPFQISDPNDSGEKLNADVGGDPYGSNPTYFAVVYERVYAANDHDIFMRQVDWAGVLSPNLYIDNSGLTLDEFPAISSTDNASTWNIVWQREVSAGNNDIMAARMSWNGYFVAYPFPLPSTTLNETHPSVSGAIAGSSRYLVTWEKDYFTDHDIVATLMDHTTALSSQNLSAMESIPAPGFWFQDQIEPSVECNGSHFVCSYAELYSTSTTDYDIYAAEIQNVANDIRVGEAHVSLAYTYDIEREPQMVNHEDSDPGSYSSVYFTVWSNSGNITMAAYIGLDGGPITSFCVGTNATCPCGNGNGAGGGCGNSVNANGGLLSWSGAPMTSIDTLTLYYSGLPASVSSLLFQSVNTINNGSGNVFGDGRRCVGAPTFRFPLRVTDGGGTTGYGYNYFDTPISWLGGVPYFGGTYNYQVWYRNTAPFCTPAGTNFTNALAVTWTP